MRSVMLKRSPVPNPGQPRQQEILTIPELFYMIFFVINKIRINYINPVAKSMLQNLCLARLYSKSSYP